MQLGRERYYIVFEKVRRMNVKSETTPLERFLMELKELAHKEEEKGETEETIQNVITLYKQKLTTYIDVNAKQTSNNMCVK